MSLKPEIATYLEAMSKVVAPELWEAPMSVHRKNKVGRIAIAGTPEPIYEAEHRFIPGLTSDLPIRIFRPSAKGPLPAMIYFHGGGWSVNTLDMYEQSLRSIANKAQIIIIAVAYQKAPEHPFPIPFDDCYTTLEWAYKSADRLGIDQNLIGVGGDSAGANLASGVALKARDEGEITLAFQLLIYPCNSFEMDYESSTKNGTGLGLTTKSMRWFWNAYLQREEDRKNPYAVPVLAKSFAHLPPAIIVTAEYDPLVDDGANYAELLKRDGVQTIYREYEGQIHGFMVLASITPDAEMAQQNVANEINALLDRTF
ncbi:MAG: alpha/beta hydrolase [Actinomycetes bacterium]